MKRIPLSNVDFVAGGFTDLATCLRSTLPGDGAEAPASISDSEEMLAKALGYAHLDDARQSAGRANITDYPQRRIDFIDEVAWGLYVASAGRVTLFAALQWARGAPLFKLVAWSEYGPDGQATKLTDELRDEALGDPTAEKMSRYGELVDATRGPQLESQQVWYQAAGMSNTIGMYGTSTGLIWTVDGRVIVGEAIGEAIDVASRRFSMTGQTSSAASAERRRLMLEVIVPGATMSLEQALLSFGARSLPGWLEVMTVVEDAGGVVGLALKNKALASFHATLVPATVQGLAASVRTLCAGGDSNSKGDASEPTGPWKTGRLVAANAKAPERASWDSKDFERGQHIRFNDAGALKSGAFHVSGGALMTRIPELLSKADLDIGGPFELDRALVEHARVDDAWEVWWALGKLVGEEAVSAYVCLNENIESWGRAAVDEARITHWARAFEQQAEMSNTETEQDVGALRREWKTFKQLRASGLGTVTGPVVERLPNEGRWRQCGIDTDEESLFWEEMLVTALPGWDKVQLHQRAIAGKIAAWLDEKDLDAGSGYEMVSGAMARLGSSMAKCDVFFEEVQPACASYVEQMKRRPVDLSQATLGVW